jgi:rRNA maturation endonuclease Nob1
MAGDFRRIEEHDSNAQAQHRALCGCGQELDLCTHGFCPRCGHRIDVARLTTVG